jgi:hypothetical protein
MNPDDKKYFGQTERTIRIEQNKISGRFAWIYQDDQSPASPSFVTIEECQDFVKQSHVISVSLPRE